MSTILNDKFYMKQAVAQAKLASDAGEIPVGAVVVQNGDIIAKTHNLTEQLGDVTAHAEMLAITAAASHIGAKYLTDCTLYITLEPCIMCAGAIKWAQLGKVVIGALDPERGYINQNIKLHKRCEVVTGVMESECKDEIDIFFKNLRR